MAGCLKRNGSGSADAQCVPSLLRSIRIERRSVFFFFWMRICGNFLFYNVILYRFKMKIC